MAKIHLGLNAEFSRSSDKPFEWAVRQAADMGYKYFEPMVHFGRELMSEAGYFHTVSMFDDPWRIKEACDQAGLTISGLQSHGPLGRHKERGPRRRPPGGLVSLEAEDSEARYLREVADTASPDKRFDRRWVVVFLDQARARLRAECLASGSDHTALLGCWALDLSVERWTLSVGC